MHQNLGFLLPPQSKYNQNKNSQVEDVYYTTCNSAAIFLKIPGWNGKTYLTLLGINSVYLSICTQCGQKKVLWAFWRSFEPNVFCFETNFQRLYHPQIFKTSKTRYFLATANQLGFAFYVKLVLCAGISCFFKLIFSTPQRSYLKYFIYISFFYN